MNYAVYMVITLCVCGPSGNSGVTVIRRSGTRPPSIRYFKIKLIVKFKIKEV